MMLSRSQRGHTVHGEPALGGPMAPPLANHWPHREPLFAMSRVATLAKHDPRAHGRQVHRMRTTSFARSGRIGNDGAAL